MHIYELTFSPTGGTKKAADILAAAIAEEIEEIDLTNFGKDYAECAFSAKDICLIAVPSYGGRVPAAAIERIAKMQGGGAQAILMAVYGNRDIDDTLLELKDALEAAGFRSVAAVSAIAEHSITREVAAGRPDTQDVEELRSFAAEILSKLGREDALSVPGNSPYKNYGGVPLKPQASENCKRCGVCAQNCPVGAISLEDPTKTDAEKCISCMRCIAVCEWKMRSNNAEIQAKIDAKLKAACAERKGNKLFI